MAVPPLGKLTTGQGLIAAPARREEDASPVVKAGSRGKALWNAAKAKLGKSALNPGASRSNSLPTSLNKTNDAVKATLQSWQTPKKPPVPTLPQLVKRAQRLDRGKAKVRKDRSLSTEGKVAEAVVRTIQPGQGLTRSSRRKKTEVQKVAQVKVGKNETLTDLEAEIEKERQNRALAPAPNWRALPPAPKLKREPSSPTDGYTLFPDVDIGNFSDGSSSDEELGEDLSSNLESTSAHLVGTSVDGLPTDKGGLQLAPPPQRAPPNSPVPHLPLQARTEPSTPTTPRVEDFRSDVLRIAGLSEAVQREMMAAISAAMGVDDEDDEKSSEEDRVAPTTDIGLSNGSSQSTYSLYPQDLNRHDSKQSIVESSQHRIPVTEFSLSKDKIEALPPTSSFLCLDSTTITDDELSQVLKRFPELTTISLYNCPNLTKECFRSLAGLSKLESINMGICSQFSPKEIYHLLALANWPELNCADFCGTAFSDDCIDLMGKFEKLEILRLNSCSEISKEGIERLQKMKEDTGLKEVWTFWIDHSVDEPPVEEDFSAYVIESFSEERADQSNRISLAKKFVFLPYILAKLHPNLDIEVLEAQIDEENEIDKDAVSKFYAEWLKEAEIEYSSVLSEKSWLAADLLLQKSEAKKNMEKLLQLQPFRLEDGRTISWSNLGFHSGMSSSELVQRITDPDTFKKVDEINLSESGITFIPQLLSSAIFPNLRKINLSRNALCVLPQKFFYKAPKLQQVNLQENQLNVFHRELLEFWPQIKILNLSSNQLSCFPQTVFCENSSLACLFLKDNQLSEASFSEKDWDCFHTDKRWQFVDFSGNNELVRSVVIPEESKVVIDTPQEEKE